ncbi:hypothetical protein D3C72_1134090 [compost metagenome]
MTHRVHDEEIGPHRPPIHLAQAGDGAFALHAAHVEQQAVAQLEAQGLGNALFHAHALGVACHPSALHHLVVLLQLGAVRDIELPVHQALGAVLGIVLRSHGLAVDLDEPATNHRVPIHLADASPLQRGPKGVGLVRHDVDDKTVHRIGRRSLAPGLDQVGAQQHQQHQRHQAHGQAADLHHRKCGPCCHLARRQHQPLWRSRLMHTAAQYGNCRSAQQRKHQHGGGKAANCNTAQCPIAAHQHQQCSKTSHSHQQHRG